MSSAPRAPTSQEERSSPLSVASLQESSSASSPPAGGDDLVTGCEEGDGRGAVHCELAVETGPLEVFAHGPRRVSVLATLGN